MHDHCKHNKSTELTVQSRTQKLKGNINSEKHQFSHILCKVQSMSLGLLVYMSLMFRHASLFDRHFRMLGRIVWKIS